MNFHLITGEQADAIGQLTTSVLHQLNHAAKCKGCNNPFGRDSEVWGGCAPQRNGMHDHTSVKCESHLFCTACVSGDEPHYIGKSGMCAGCIEEATEEWLKTPGGAGKTAADFKPRKLPLALQPPAKFGMVKHMLEASVGGLEDARDAAARRVAEAQRAERGEMSGGEQRRAVQDAGGVVAFLEAAHARGYTGDCTSTGWPEYMEWDRAEREREQARARQQAEVAATAAAAAAKEEAEAAAAEAAKVEAAKVEAATAAAAALAAKEKKKLEAAKDKAEAKAKTADERRKAEEQRAKDASKRAVDAANEAAEAKAQVTASLHASPTAAACEPVSDEAAALAAGVFGPIAAVMPAAPAAFEEDEDEDEAADRPLGIMAGSKRNRGKGQAKSPVVAAPHKKKQRKGGSTSLAVEAKALEPAPASGRPLRAAAAAAFSAIAAGGTVHAAPDDLVEETEDGEIVECVEAEEADGDDPDAEVVDSRLVDDEDEEEEEEEEPPPKKGKGKAAGGGAFFETRKRAGGRSDDAKRYRAKQLDVIEAAEETCTRIRKCHPFALTVNRHSNGAKKNDAIPHPGHATYKSFEHKWQWVNMATSVLEEVGELVELDHGNSKALMALLLEHGCGGDKAKLATMLTGSAYKGPSNDASDEDMADAPSPAVDHGDAA